MYERIIYVVEMLSGNIKGNSQFAMALTLKKIDNK